MGVIDTEYADQDSVERYRQLLHTAPPDDLELTHEAAFGRLNAAQRVDVMESLASVLDERECARLSEAPASLARAATRAEIHKAGTLERCFGDALFATVAEAFMGTVFAATLFTGLAYERHEERGSGEDDAPDSWDEELDGSDFSAHG